MHMPGQEEFFGHRQNKKMPKIKKSHKKRLTNRSWSCNNPPRTAQSCGVSPFWVSVSSNYLLPLRESEGSFQEQSNIGLPADLGKRAPE